jgi:hypothetical protein
MAAVNHQSSAPGLHDRGTTGQAGPAACGLILPLVLRGRTMRGVGS